MEQRIALSRPGSSLRRRYDPQTQRTLFGPSRHKKEVGKRLPGLMRELMMIANRLGGSYQPIIHEVEPDELPEEGEVE